MTLPRFRTVLVGVLFVLVVAGSSAAQQRTGVRVGVSGDPDQFVVGGHLETAPLLERVVFRPNLEVGIGSDLTLIAFNLELAYKLPLEDSAWGLYVGGGPALNVYSFNGDGRRRGDDTSAEGGFNILLGAEHDGGLFTEFKVGASDSPDLKLLIGYSF